MATQDLRSHGAPTDPYRVFFPLGVLLGGAGVSIWLLYGLGLTSRFSGRAHAYVQVAGFLYAFVAGFLLTAIPRFTGTTTPALRTQWVLAAGLVVTSVAYELEAFTWGHVGFLAVHFAVIVLAVRRVRRRRNSPPPTFALVGLGMLAGAAGGLVNLGVSSTVLDPHWDLLGRRLLTEGMVLMLVLGVGGFLGPRLLGFAALPDFQARDRMPGSVEPLLARRDGLPYAAAGLLIVLSVVLDYGFGMPGMAIVRAVMATLLIGYTLRPWRRPAVRSTLAWCVWSAHWFVIAGLWVIAVAPPAYRVDLLHVVFMGGFTLLILAVGIRVTLSHGGHDLSQERRSWPLRVGIATGLFALAARVGAGFVQESFFEHLTVASLAWIAGVAFWGLYILRFIRADARR